MCITGDSSDGRRELQVGELFFYLLTFFTSEVLCHGLQLYGYSDLGSCWLLDDELSDPF